MLLPGRDPAERLAVALSPVPTRNPVSATYIPLFDLAFDMKRHVSQVKGNKQNAATAPHLCLHMIRSLARTCLTATDPYQPPDFLAVFSPFALACNFLHLTPCSVGCCGSLAPSLWHFPSLSSTPSVGNALTCPPHCMQCQGQVIWIFISSLNCCSLSKQLSAALSRSSSNTAVDDIVAPWKPDLFFC